MPLLSVFLASCPPFLALEHALSHSQSMRLGWSAPLPGSSSRRLVPGLVKWREHDLSQTMRVYLLEPLRKRHILSARVAKLLGHKLRLLVAILATMCGVPTGNEARRQKVRIPGDSTYGSSHLETYVHSPWSFHLYVSINFLFCSVLQVEFLLFLSSKCSTDWNRFISPSVRTITYTCPNLTPFNGALSLCASTLGYSGRSKLCGVRAERYRL